MGNPLHELLFAPHADSPRPFLIDAAGTATSHAAFRARAAAFAHALAALGLVPGDRIAAQVAKSPDALALFAAAVTAGVVYLPLNTAYTPAEVAYFIADAGAAALVCDPSAEAALAPVAAAAGARLVTLGTDGSGSLPELAAGRPERFDPVSRDDDDLAALLYTSGTTGRAKGAMLSHRNLVSNAEVLAGAWGFSDRDVLIHALPVFHTHGLFVATGVCLVAGAPMIFLPRFDAAEVLAVMPRATAMMGVPTFYTRLLDEPGLTRAATAHMRLFVSGSAPLRPETHRAFAARTGHAILERYGMTETGMNTSNPLEGERRAGTVGRPLPGISVRVTASGRAAGPGETGMIEVKGPNVFRGYWNLAEKTAAEFTPDGWFMTGDLGRFDADGYLEIVGRAKDLIIAGGYNIYPREVEAALDALPGVRESAVIGVPHPDLGEAVVAVVVPGGAPPAPAELAAALAPRLARFKLPRHIAFRSELPRNAMGKVQKAALRAEFATLFARTEETLP